MDMEGEEFFKEHAAKFRMYKELDILRMFLAVKIWTEYFIGFNPDGRRSLRDAQSLLNHYEVIWASVVTNMPDRIKKEGEQE